MPQQDEQTHVSFRQGDWCALKTGGPLMVVKSCDNGVVVAVWYTNGKEQLETVPADELQRLE